MITSSIAYKQAVFAPSRETRARANLTMSALSQQPSITTVLTADYTYKVSGSVAENPHIHKRKASATLEAPSGFTFEPPQSDYNAIMTVNGVASIEATTTNTFMAMELFSYNVLSFLERKLGRGIWGGANKTVAQKVTIAKSLITGINAKCTVKGSSPTGNKANFIAYKSGSWQGTNFHTNSTFTELSFGSSNQTDAGLFIDADGWIHFMAHAEPSNGTVASRIEVDQAYVLITVVQTTTQTYYDDKIISFKVLEETGILNLSSPANELQLTLDNTDGKFDFLTLNNLHTIIASRPRVDIDIAVVLADGSEEWIPLGSYWMTNWQMDRGQMSITFYCHDALLILSNTVFPITNITNVGVAVQNLFANASIVDYYYDPSLDTLDGNNRPTRITNSRELLQNLAMTTGLTLYQDRYGVVKLEKFADLQSTAPFTVFTTTQNSLGGFHTTSQTVGGVPLKIQVQSTDGGMRTVPFDQMYEIPQITLDQSVYQLQINVYKTNPNDNSYDTYTFTNPNISGNNGESFTIDVALVQSLPTAQAIADRIFKETMYNAVYLTRWRQNPVLMATDTAIVSDSETSAKLTRVTKQEFIYQGYLTGTIESRGGI